MTRISGNEIRYGRVWNGFDYELQVWVRDGIIQNCGHPEMMRTQDGPCCNAYHLAGQKILDIPNAQSKDLDNVSTEIYGLSQAPSRKTS
jgi:hypothetical protein